MWLHMLLQDLGLQVPDIVTLDGRLIGGEGIVSGKSFEPRPLKQAPYCFGLLGKGLGTKGLLLFLLPLYIEHMYHWVLC